MAFIYLFQLRSGSDEGFAGIVACPRYLKDMRPTVWFSRVRAGFVLMIAVYIGYRGWLNVRQQVPRNLQQTQTKFAKFKMIVFVLAMFLAILEKEDEEWMIKVHAMTVLR